MNHNHKRTNERTNYQPTNTFDYNHRRRHLEMTVGARFHSPSILFPFLSFLPSLPCLPSLHSRPSPITFSSSVPHLLSLCRPLRLSLYHYPLNLARDPWECCKLPQWIRAEPSRQTLYGAFQAAISAPFHFHNDTSVIFTTSFVCVQRRRNKITVGATLGHRPHNFLAVGAIAPIALMESAPMIATSPVMLLDSFVIRQVPSL